MSTDAAKATVTSEVFQKVTHKKTSNAKGTSKLRRSQTANSQDSQSQYLVETPSQAKQTKQTNTTPVLPQPPIQ